MTPTRTARKKEFQATPQRGPPVRQPSDQRRSLRRRSAKAGEGVAAVVGDEGVGEHLHDRHEDEEGDGRHDEADGADDEDVAADGAAGGDAEGEEEEEGEGGQRARRSPCRTGGRRARRRGLPASRSASRGGRWRSPGARSQARPMAPTRTRRRPKAGSDLPRPQVRSGRRRMAPRGASQSFSPWATRERAGAASSSSGQPSRSPGEAPEAVVDGVPGQEREADEPDRRPEDDGRVERPVAGGRRHPATAGARRPPRPTSRAGACARRWSRTWRSRSRSA